MDTYINRLAWLSIILTISVFFLIESPQPVFAALCSADCNGLEEDVVQCEGSSCECHDGDYGEYAWCQCDDEPRQNALCVPTEPDEN